jgi:formylglycine-generating enzyme required for sulfatase activity
MKYQFLLIFIFPMMSCYHDEFETTMSIRSQAKSDDFVCTPSMQRCNGDLKQSCNLQGKWEDIACPMGYTCFEIDQIPTCQKYDQPLTDLFVMDMQGDMQTDIQFDMQTDINLDVQAEVPVCEANCPEIEMILIEAGLFVMGNDNGSSVEKPEHPVQILNSFYVGKTEVTLGQYRACVQAGVCTTPNQTMYCNWTDHIETMENYPVNCVDWTQARVFAKWLGGDLMTESQWEYVATAQGQDIKYPWGNMEPSCSFVNYRNCVNNLSPVCSTIDGNTAQGICDMAGNVWEWVLDEYHDSYIGAPQNEEPWCTEMSACHLLQTSDHRIFRGGSWYDDTWRLTSKFRDHYSSDYRDNRLGFRIVKPNMAKGIKSN